MKKNIFVLFLLSFCSFNGVSADQVSCEKIESVGWSWGEWKTCFMHTTTQINSADTTITTQDESVQGLYFYNNKKVFFLPIALSEKFPNLLGLNAAHCSLTTISKANFKGLSELRGLYLYNNQIEKITSDVFDDLVALEHLYMSVNKLKFINGKAFARLTKLTRVYLYSNQCINENFDGSSRIAVLQKTVNEKCSYDEVELDEYVKKTFSIVSSLAVKKCEKPQDLATFTTTLEGIKMKTSDVISKLNELKTQQKEECGNIARALEAQGESHAKALKDQQTYFNEALEAQSKALEAQTKVIEAQAKTLKEQKAEIIDINVKSEIETILKMTEIQRLEERLQRKNAEIIEKNEKIKKLEEKNEIMCANF